MKTLVIDIGGTNVKFAAQTYEEIRKFPSGRELTPARMVEGIKEHAHDWKYDRVSIGYPGPVVKGRPAAEPHNLAFGWVGFDFDSHFGKPTKLVNDAAMQALGSYEGGQMLFLGLGTGLGSALVNDKALVPLELAHLPYRKGKTFEDYVGVRGMDKFGKRKWREYVADVAERLRNALVADYVVLGGGNVKKLDELPPHCRAGDNVKAYVGGLRLWEDAYTHMV